MSFKMFFACIFSFSSSRVLSSVALGTFLFNPVSVNGSIEINKSSQELKKRRLFKCWLGQNRRARHSEGMAYCVSHLAFFLSQFLLS